VMSHADRFSLMRTWRWLIVFLLRSMSIKRLCSLVSRACFVLGFRGENFRDYVQHGFRGRDRGDIASRSVAPCGRKSSRAACASIRSAALKSIMARPSFSRWLRKRSALPRASASDLKWNRTRVLPPQSFFSDFLRGERHGP